jgi:cell division protein FtsI/penicillin-binding protein 2
VVDFEGILAKSSNIGMGFLAERMGREAVYNIVCGFGFGTLTGVDFPGEAEGILRPLRQWTSYSTTSVPIGQELTATPLQLTRAFSAIVNGGKMVKPRLVRALLLADGRVAERFEGGEVVRDVLPEAVSEYMRGTALVGVVENGGGKSAGLEKWQVLGKTGTAEVAYAAGGGYEPGAYIGSFVGAAPAESPVAVCLVMIHRPNAKLGYYGSKVAAPAVGRILEDALTYWRVPPSPGRETVGEMMADVGGSARIGGR